MSAKRFFLVLVSFIIIVSLFFIIGFYCGSRQGGGNIDRRTISKLDQQLAASQSRLTDAIATNTKLKEELRKGAAANSAAHSTARRISDINKEQSGLTGSAESCNSDCAKLIDECLRLLEKARKGN